MASFSDRRVLVTGAGGFIGSWLTEKLLEEGAKVSVLIDDSGAIGTSGIDHVIKKTRAFRGNLTRPETLSSAVRDQEVVFHLAALTQVIHSFSMPREFFDVNATGTLNLLEKLRKSDALDFLVFSSTDKVYGEPQRVPIDESHALSAKSPYDASKLAADVLIDSYHSTYGTPAAKIRWSNTIGGRDTNILRAVPDFVSSIMRGKPPTIRGDGRQVRDYMYVTDAVSGIMAVAQKKKKSNGETFNLGTETPTSVLQMSNLVIDVMGMRGKMKPVVLGKNNPGEINVQYLSSKKARDALGWSPKVGLKDGVLKSVEWYRAHPEWYDVMRRVNGYWDAKMKK
ncbi:MAG: GDP-mannose 4,6-dehydratase [Candidatus Aenigmarchaeota archaeon]|nr:GDP-mannose 4,6-dehydratase [Candidatus Aenigmarchaeota archaeon]